LLIARLSCAWRLGRRNGLCRPARSALDPDGGISAIATGVRASAAVAYPADSSAQPSVAASVPSQRVPFEARPRIGRDAPDPPAIGLGQAQGKPLPAPLHQGIEPHVLDHAPLVPIARRLSGSCAGVRP